MIIVCISDTHNRLGWEALVPEGDVLIHAGDSTMMGSPEEVAEFDASLARLPHRHKLVIAGNHDWFFYRNRRNPGLAQAFLKNAVYLQDSLFEIDDLKIYGSPWQPEFGGWAFNLARGPRIKEKWDLIPPCDILVTHGPPAGHGDEVCGEKVGCVDLLEAVRRVKPRLHVFGHIHEGYGVTDEGPTTLANVSVCDRGYRPVNPPFVWVP